MSGPVDYFHLFRGAPARLIVLDPPPGYVVAEASEGWLRSRRLRREALVGRRFFDDFRDEPGCRAMRISVEHVIASRVADEFSAPIYDSGGKLVCVVHRDGATETELLRSAEQRDQAMHELEAAKEGLEAFAYSASHDLRAPLRAIGGYCGLLRNLEPGMLPPIANDLLARMDAGVRNMTGIVEGMLRLTQADTLRMTRQRVDITAVARRIARDLQLHQAGRKVRICVAESLEAQADESLVSIVLENLIGNAWKYTARTSDARIDIGQRKVVGRQVFFVSDNGPGFEMARARKLFTPFFRLHTATEFEGHGIGLATVKRGVERHGGEVWAESHPGRGTTIHFTLG